jgi:HTH-type transcriptional regulator / antitoxin HigA
MIATRGKRPVVADRIAIRNESELDAAAKEICSLLSRISIIGSDKKRLDALVDAVESYESVHHQIPEPSQSEMLLHLLDAKDVTSRALAKATGLSHDLITEILQGSRTASDAEVEAFAAYFNVDKSVLKVPVVVTILTQSSNGKTQAMLKMSADLEGAVELQVKVFNPSWPVNPLVTGSHSV